MRIGLATSVLSNYSIHEAIQIISNSGYDCIDIWGGRPHIYRNDYSKKELRSLRSEIYDMGIQISSFMPAFYRYPYNLCSSNKKIVKDSLEYVFCCIDNALILGVPVLLVCAAKLMEGQNRAEAWDILADNIRTICHRVKPDGMNIGLEVVNKNTFDLINETSDALRMIEYVGANNLGIVLDSGHLYLSGESIEGAVVSIRKQLLQIHVNDNDGNKQQNLIPGEGSFNFREFFKSLEMIGYDGVVSAEITSDYGQQIPTAIKKSAEQIKSFLNK
jgi:protein FrlC